MSEYDLPTYLPKYLSPGAAKELTKALRQFVDSGESRRLYTNRLVDEECLFQGDGIDGLPMVMLPDATVADTPAIIITNTCDMDTSNRRPFPIRIAYVPLLNLEKYAEMLERRELMVGQALEAHLFAIRNQQITYFFYLPANGNSPERIAALDRPFSASRAVVPEDSTRLKRLFTLSDFGAYLFVLKLSIHFTRLTDGVERRHAD